VGQGADNARFFGISSPTIIENPLTISNEPTVAITAASPWVRGPSDIAPARSRTMAGWPV